MTNYPIINSKDLVPRDQIRTVPEQDLDPLIRAELNNLRRGIGYKVVTADTPSNHENITFKTTYFQMVAYKEGWTFDPKLFQVEFLQPGDSRLGPKSYQSRIWRFADGSNPTVHGLPIRLSPNNHLGFELNERTDEVRVLDDSESDNLVAKVTKLFPKLVPH